jgi:hypothetical protein
MGGWQRDLWLSFITQVTLENPASGCLGYRYLISFINH